MAGHMAFDPDRTVHLAGELPVKPALQGRPVDQRREVRGHGERASGAQASPPVARLVVPSAAIAFTRFLAITIRCTSEGPS